jgi:nitrile hydratase
MTVTDPAAGDFTRRQHDLGGLELGPVDRHEHPRTLFEMRVDAMLMLLTHPSCGAFKVDAMRRAVENYSRLDYEQLPYYHRWLKAIRQLLVEQRVLTDEAIEARLAVLRARQESGGQ